MILLTYLYRLINRYAAVHICDVVSTITRDECINSLFFGSNDARFNMEDCTNHPNVYIIYLWSMLRINFIGMESYSIQLLDIKLCECSLIPDFQLPQLRTLSITYCRFLLMIPDFRYIPLLTTLNISNNREATIPNFRHLPKLLSLDCHETKSTIFTNLHMLNELICGCHGIQQTLNVQGYSPVRIDRMFISDLANKILLCVSSDNNYYVVKMVNNVSKYGELLQDKLGIPYRIVYAFDRDPKISMLEHINFS